MDVVKFTKVILIFLKKLVINFVSKFSGIHTNENKIFSPLYNQSCFLLLFFIIIDILGAWGRGS